MSSQRIKGQETSIIIVRGGVLEDTLTDVLSFNAEFQSETKVQGFLGEKSNRTDDIYNQCKVDLELHVHTQDYFAFQKAIIDRQKRITPDLQINIMAVMFFPNGQTPTVLFSDVKFGSIPMNIANRSDYVKFKVDGVCDDYEVQT
jgi:hypothetical protein